jgi:hypothetical protein
MRYFDAPMLDEQRKPLVPHKIISGSLPGATEIRIGGSESIKISGKNQNITITTDDGTIIFGRREDGSLALEVENADGTVTGLGVVPGSTDLGFYTTDTAGNVVQKIVGATRTVNDITNDVGTILDGLLPDGSYGAVVAKEGEEVEDVFS